MKRWPAAGVVFAILWMFVRGATVTPKGLVTEFLVGLAVGLSVSFAARRLYEDELPMRWSARLIPYALVYITVFSKDVIIANFDVAYRVLAPWAPIKPDVIVIPLRVHSDLAITTIANSITLTPGTLTMDYREQDNALIVHTLYMETRADIVDPIRTWEDYALVIFSEGTAPGEPAPAFERETGRPPGSGGGGGRDGD